MAILSAALRESVAIAYGTNAPYVGVFTADPGTTITNEVAGGSYARVALSWTAGASDGVITASATINIPASTTITYIGICSASTAGSLLDKAAITSQTFATAGTYALSLTFTES